MVRIRILCALIVIMNIYLSECFNIATVSIGNSQIETSSSKRDMFQTKSIISEAIDEKCSYSGHLFDYLLGNFCGGYYKTLGLNRRGSYPKIHIEKAYKLKSELINAENSEESELAALLLDSAYSCLLNDSCKKGYDAKLDYLEMKAADTRKLMMSTVYQTSFALATFGWKLTINSAASIVQNGLSIWQLLSDLDNIVISSSMKYIQSSILSGWQEVTTVINRVPLAPSFLGTSPVAMLLLRWFDPSNSILKAFSAALTLLRVSTLMMSDNLRLPLQPDPALRVRRIEAEKNVELGLLSGSTLYLPLNVTDRSYAGCVNTTVHVLESIDSTQNSVYPSTYMSLNYYK